jgi:hypothetical protein
MSRRPGWRIAVAALLALYAGSYSVLSRCGYTRDGYFFPPRDTRSWRILNYGCVVLYSPLILADCALGASKPPASEPLFGLGKPSAP